jgi:UDP-N-acetylmuramate--alanine ligase
MQNLNTYKNFYFVGIGGIGMSALARYFHAAGKNVLGYDKTETKLTTELQKEGISIVLKMW